MQNNIEKSQLPYDVLMQGAKGRRFVRSALPEEPASEVKIESADKTKTEEPAKDDVKNKEAGKTTPVLNVDIVLGADGKPLVKVSEEKIKRDVPDDKGDSKTNAEDKSKTDEAAKKEESPQEPKKDDESADKPSEMDKGAAKKLKKRDANEELQETDAASDGAPADSTTEPTVGIALPILPPLLALKTLPIGLNAGVLPLNLAGLKAQLQVKKSKYSNLILQRADIHLKTR